MFVLLVVGMVLLGVGYFMSEELELVGLGCSLMLIGILASSPALLAYYREYQVVKQSCDTSCLTDGHTVATYAPECLCNLDTTRPTTVVTEQPTPAPIAPAPVQDRPKDAAGYLASYISCSTAKCTAETLKAMRKIGSVRNSR